MNKLIKKQGQDNIFPSFREIFYPILKFKRCAKSYFIQSILIKAIKYEPNKASEDRSEIIYEHKY
jgi:hypothetical protein